MTDLAALADKLNRTVKLAVDTGEVDSIEDAERLFHSYRLQILVGEDVAENTVLQAALLTAVNCAARTLLGGVTVIGARGRAMPPFAALDDLSAAVVQLGAQVSEQAKPGIPTILVGDVGADALDSQAVRLTVSRWSGGVCPSRSGFRLDEVSDFVPAGVLAGALAVSEVFQRLRGNPAACRRGLGFDLAAPESDWTVPSETPPLDRLPAEAWLVGLGNLGQAYLWTLLLLPYSDTGPRVVLQDTDTLAPSNLSTSLLTSPDMLGRRKTRAMAALVEARGGHADIVERSFAPDFRVGPAEPSVALIGVDNARARQGIEDVGFARVIEAGLGRGPHDYLGFNVHTFPSTTFARALWSSPASGNQDVDVPAYQALLRSTNDPCGVVRFAGRSIGAPFVGATAAAFVIAELIKLVLGMQRLEMMSCHLRETTGRLVVRGDAWLSFNPGMIRAAA